MYNPDDPWAWVAKAENDLLNIRNNLGCERIPWDTICFHAQQVAEKMLKAFLVSRGQTAGRTHDLVALLAEAVATGGPLNELETECRLLMRRHPVSAYSTLPSASMTRMSELR